MAIKDLLVAYDGNDASQKAVAFAVQMAKKYGATVTGVHVVQPERYDSHVRRWIPESVLANMRAAEQEVESSIEAAFHAKIKEAGLGTSAKWISSKGNPNVVLPRYARYFDMMIVGQFANVHNNESRSVHPEELLLRSGKPMIIVPRNYSAQPFKEEAAVAWDGSRSAARALTDAMQILETKKKLDVIRLVASDVEEKQRVLPEHDLIAHLKAHGINAELVSLKAKKSAAGATILMHCAQTQPDILVMGAYGRGKFGSMLFGSATLHVLDHMSVPVLMSH